MSLLAQRVERGDIDDLGGTVALGEVAEKIVAKIIRRELD